MNNQPLVSIKCAVYNHEKYLRECLEGFVMQKTNFPFEAIVHDDASTDGSAAIIREYAEKYPHIIKPIYETENQYSKHDGSLARIMNAAISPSSKYIALCEGDDFWIDPRKLQIQFDFMESHPDYSLCMHHILVLDELNKILYKKVEQYHMSEQRSEYSKQLIVRGAYYATQSIFLRKDIYDKSMNDIKRDSVNAPMGDTQLMFHLGLHGNVKLLHNVMAIYRKHCNSAMNYDNSLLHKEFRTQTRIYLEKLATNNNHRDWWEEMLQFEKLLNNQPKKHIVLRIISGIKNRIKYKIDFIRVRLNYYSYIVCRRFRTHGTNFFKI